MRKKLTIKSFQLFIMVGIFMASFSIQTLFAIDLPQKLEKSGETPKNKPHFSTSSIYEDVVIDDLVMYDEPSNPSTPTSRSTSLNTGGCNWGIPQTMNSDDSHNITIENGSPWAAIFEKSNKHLTVNFSYDAQTDILSFGKTLDNGITYIIAQNNSSIIFYLNRKPFVILDRIQNCGQNVCLTVQFMINKTTMSLKDCTSASPSYRMGSQNFNNNTAAQQKTGIALDVAEDVNIGAFKNNSVVSMHQVVPNPINNQTYIKYHLFDNAQVRVSIYNAIGQQIKVLVNQNQTKGEQSIVWNVGDELKSGMYFYEIIANNERMIGKVIMQ